MFGRSFVSILLGVSATAAMAILAPAALSRLPLSQPALAEGGSAGFPDHPIKVIVAVPAGGGVDTVTRIVADAMRRTLNQPLIVENKAGVGGSIGGRICVQFARRRLHAIGLAAVADHDQCLPL